MQLESLANELLLDLFSYIKSVHLLRAFYGLNSRFNTLLIVHFRSNPLDFRYVSKTDFDIVCQQQLPSLTHHIHSLNLFNDDKTCQQIERFLSHNLTLIQFTNLQSLTLGYINFEIMEKLLNHLSSLSHLTYLHLIETFIQFHHIDIIFRLPKLIYCYLYSIANTHSSYQPTARSASIKKFSLIYPMRYNLKYLLENMSCLQYISLPYMDSDDSIQNLSCILSTLETLKINFTKSIYGLVDLLQHMPNLVNLTVDVILAYVDGYEWKKIIINYMPKLRTFHLRMRFSLRSYDTDDDDDDENQLDSIVDTFRDSFWIDEHQCFIRCHWYQNGIYKNYYLYTLPHVFNYHASPAIFKPFQSTYFKEDKYHYSFNHIRQLTLDKNLSSIDVLQNQFSNIRDLKLSFPTNENYFTIFSSLNRLRSLSVSFNMDTPIARCQLQTLLDRAPNVFSLRIKGMIPTDIISKSIRQLSFYDNYSCFNEQTCMALCNSLLGNQCEILSISINNRLIILDFIHNMKDLRILQFDYQEDTQSISNNELIHWLKQTLPSTYTISIDGMRNITIWIR